MKRRPFMLMTACAGLAPWVSARADTIRLKFAHASPEESTLHQAALKFAETAKKASNDRLRIKVYHSSQLGNDASVIGGVRGGTIDMMMAGSVNFAGMMPAIGVLDLPFLFRDAAQAHTTLDGAVGQELMKGFQAHGLEGITWFEIGFRCITTRNRTVRVPDDVRGLKIRTTPNPSHIQAFKLLGANPVPMPIGELYQALETGAVDAQEHPVIITWSSKFHEVQKHLTLSNHAYTPMPIVMNQKRYASLEPELQKILKESAYAACVYQRELNTKSEAQTLSDLKETGMQIVTDFDAEPFRKIIVEPTRQAFIKQNGDALLKQIDAMHAS